MSPPKEYGYIQIYGQGGWHDPAYILGDQKGLLDLHDAITQALRVGQGKATVMVSDGEGYGLNVVATTHEALDQLRLPYTDVHCKKPELQLDPWDLVVDSD